MKGKGIIAMLFVALVVGVTMAEMNDSLFSVAYTPSTTNSSVMVVRGELRGIYVDTQSNNGSISGTLSITSMGVTVFSKAAITADAYFRPMLLAHDSTGSNIDIDPAGGTTNNVYCFPPLAGAVTVQWLDGGSASNGTVNVRLIYNQ